MNRTIRYVTRVSTTRVLGPYERAAVWVFGCCFDCEGCIAHRYKSGTSLSADASEMAAWFLSTGKEHLTISGGEPFLQADALAEMIAIIRRSCDAGVIIYSGFTLEELSERARTDSGVSALLKAVDILIDGRYIRELDDERPYIGSSNQRVIPLTDRYAEAIDSYYNSGGARKIELSLDAEKTLLVGVPSVSQRQLWEQMKEFADRRESQNHPDHGGENGKEY